MKCTACAIIISVLVVFEGAEARPQGRHRRPKSRNYVYYPDYSSPTDYYNVPNYNVPSYNVPNYNVPSYNIPNYNVPDYNVPNYNVPDYNVPNYNIQPDEQYYPNNNPTSDISDNESDDILLEGGQLQRRCTPNRSFKKHCNDCICSSDGGSYSCTEHNCENMYPVVIRPPENRVQKLCEPGVNFMKDCLHCSCNSNGMPENCQMFPGWVCTET